jgi:hypothetical protein
MSIIKVVSGIISSFCRIFYKDNILCSSIIQVLILHPTTCPDILSSEKII